MTKLQRQQMQAFLNELRKLCADHAVSIRVPTDDAEPNAFISIAGSEELEFMDASGEQVGAWHEDDEEPITA